MAAQVFLRVALWYYFWELLKCVKRDALKPQCAEVKSKLFSFPPQAALCYMVHPGRPEAPMKPSQAQHYPVGKKALLLKDICFILKFSLTASWETECEGRLSDYYQNCITLAAALPKVDIANSFGRWILNISNFWFQGKFFLTTDSVEFHLSPVLLSKK